MGVGLEVLEFFNRSINMTIGSIAGKRMVELGDQKLHADIAVKEDGSRVWFKDWIEARGCHHYSIDIHGMNGSYPIDLNKPIDSWWINNFDIVTNFGTSEHIENQWLCWQNIYDFGKNGCVYIHVVPERNKYHPEHSPHFYDQAFFANLIAENDCKMVLNESIIALGHIGCCFIKPYGRNNGFVFFDDAWLKGGKKQCTFHP